MRCAIFQPTDTGAWPEIKIARLSTPTSTNQALRRRALSGDGYPESSWHVTLPGPDLLRSPLTRRACSGMSQRAPRAHRLALALFSRSEKGK